MSDGLLCLMLCLSFVGGELFQRHPVDALAMENEEVEFNCALKAPGVLVWLFGEKSDLQIFAKGGHLRDAGLKSVFKIEKITNGEKLKIGRVALGHGSGFACRDNAKKKDALATLYVFTKPSCRTEGTRPSWTLICHSFTTKEVTVEGDLSCANVSARATRTRNYVELDDMLGRRETFVNATLKWTDRNLPKCELSLTFSAAQTSRVFQSTKVAEVKMNVSSGYTVLLGSFVNCWSSAGFLEEITMHVNYSSSSYGHNGSTIQMNRAGRANITCSVRGLFGDSKSNLTLVDIKVQARVELTPCEYKGGMLCFTEYSDLLEGGLIKANVSLADLRSLCLKFVGMLNCTNYMEPCIWSRKMRGLKDGLMFICSNLNSEPLQIMLNTPLSTDCLDYNFHLLPHKADFLNANGRQKTPKTANEVIYQRGASFLENALLESCTRNDISVTFNRTVSEWILQYRKKHFSGNPRLFDEYIDHENKTVITSQCIVTPNAMSSNNTCLVVRECINALVGLSDLVYYGIVLVKNETAFAAEVCGESVENLQICSHQLMDYYEDKTMRMVVNHLTVLFDFICEREWTSWTNYSKCLLKSKNSESMENIKQCVRTLLSSGGNFATGDDYFLNPDNQTSLCISVVKFLECVEGNVTDMCDSEAGMLQRKFSRLSLSTDMEDMFCYSSFSY